MTREEAIAETKAKMKILEDKERETDKIKSEIWGLITKHRINATELI